MRIPDTDKNGERFYKIDETIKEKSRFAGGKNVRESEGEISGRK